jgi:regulator of protease activity HflC (stomatin/prohibitin superfamily)
MARQMKAERLKRAEILEAEGDKSSAILRAEGSKQSAILEAEGKREAAFRDAEARERAAEAEAKATQFVSDAIASNGQQAINYFVAQEYTKAVGKFADSPNAKTILFPVETTQLIGSLGGIGELVRSAMQPGESNPGDSGVPLSGGRDPVTRERTRPSVPRTGGGDSQ